MKKINPVVWAVLAVPVIYMAMVLACSYEAGTDLFALMERFGLLLGRPDLLRWTAYTPRCILGALVCYGLAVTLYYSDHENRRPGEEYGSAKWGSARELNKQYADPNGKNVILTKHVSIPSCFSAAATSPHHWNLCRSCWERKRCIPAHAGRQRVAAGQAPSIISRPDAT